MRRRNDMGSLYDQHMEFFGLGTALFHPNSASDMRPPCVGYLDASRRWNHIANVPFPDWPESVYKPLEKVPQKMADLKIEWRPKTSLGVRQYTVSAEGETPDGLPAGANASIRYASKTKFGAILIAQKPVKLISYNDETLFRHWINENYSMLAQLHGVELSRYGLWLVTRTYSTPKASINAWLSKDKDAVLTLKAKAEMAGDAGAEVSWTDKSTDKDWTHHAAPEGVIAFFDGIEIPGWQWWYAGVKARLKKNLGLSRRLTLNRDALGPYGSWRAQAYKKRDPSEPPIAPGADDHWAIKKMPVLKENEIFVSDVTEKKGPQEDALPAKEGNNDHMLHLSIATVANGNPNQSIDGIAEHDHQKIANDEAEHQATSR